MPFLNHRLRTLQTESFRNLGAAFSPSLFLFLSLNFVPKYLKISFLPLCIYKNVEKNRAKTGHFLLQFLPSNHNILWSNMPIFLIFHNTASELPTQHGKFVKCSVFKSLYSFVHSQIAYKIKYFLIVQTLPPCAFLCCMSAMVASRWQCHH